jgi:aminopeptidase-like protein
MNIEETEQGNLMYEWATDLFPINRSLTGEGVKETLRYIKKILPELNIKSVHSGEQVFDWKIPNEWNVKDAYIITPKGKKVANFKKNNLHLVGYSASINEIMSLADLKPHLHTIKNIPDAIPYITSYYSENWGFCITENEMQKLEEGDYKVVIDSTLEKGELNYAEIIIPGKETKEILISTYICHPSMANNELSGPVVTMQLVKWLKEQDKLRYTYRIVFVPETIGSITYISKNFNHLKKHVLGGFVVTCVGDDNNYSILTSKWGNSLFDKIGMNVLKNHTDNKFKVYSFLDRGSDERQYSSVGVDIPVINLMRSKYGEYKEYHTSLDNLDFISPQGLFGGFEIHRKSIYLLENNYKYKVTLPCEPQLGKRGLYPNTSTTDTQKQIATMMNIIAYLDGETDIVDVANIIAADGEKCISIIKQLMDAKVIIKVD